MEMMKARVLHGVNDLRYQDYPVPTLKEDEVLLKVKACGICGSDIPRIFVNGTYHFPTIPGHEFAGEVVAAASKENEHLVGMHAAVFPLIPCKKCTSCNKGVYETCKSYDYLGSRSDGAFAEYVRVPVWNLVPIADNLPFEEAAMAEPVAVALHALRRAQIEIGDTVVIYGPGTIGMLIAQWARAWGAKKVLLVGTDLNNYDFIEELGFNDYFNASHGDPIQWVMEQTNGNGADIAIEAVGIATTACNCLDSVASGGKVIFVGNPHGDFTFPQNTYWQILRKQLSIFGTWNSSYNNTPKSDWSIVVDAMASGVIKVKPLITHRFTLENMDEGLNIMKENKEFYSKVMVIND
ncbi:MAG: galactitol-1-phosphate 5-dehydrogenase [Oscillospiraceae bacterium]|nr:galactitol-1-phosphate 5-dehydrogenase [Oscillospiraceae bacterium]